jgi:hypothetical protein
MLKFGAFAVTKLSAVAEDPGASSLLKSWLCAGQKMGRSEPEQMTCWKTSRLERVNK